ncbi:putative transcription factor bHLH041 isoform X2 [Setaria italica]|nr:putative transcription factor bHLH041 isoform X2 [Setaria italica]
MELPANDLTASASLPVQQQFYEMAAFMGCESGEIEVGMSTPASGGSPMSLESSLHQVFSEDFFQQSLLEELLQLPPTRPSSPSSSLPSVSVGSPAAEGSTSLLRTLPVTPPPVATPSSGPERQAPAPPLHHPRPPLASPFSRHGGRLHFPSPDADDAAMAEAMLAVISASSSSALPTTHPSTSTAAPPPGNHHHHGARRWPRRRGTTTTAFRAYNAALAPRVPWRPPGAPGQRMIKMGISILRRMHMLRFSRERTGGATAMAQQAQEEEEDTPAAPTSSQLNHMISERRRRERLNESFEALRGLLPPGSKKDKATVLAKTLDYMNILVAQIADLEARNRSLESRAHQHANGGGGGGGGGWKERPYYSSSEQQEVVVLQGLSGGTSERVGQVHVTAASGAAASASSSSSSAVAGREVTVRVEARAAHGDVAELVARALAVIKEMGRFTVVAVDARRPGDGAAAHATFTLRATAGEFDEASLREAVMKVAAEDSATPAPSDDDS